jgi:hypothetical protein
LAGIEVIIAVLRKRGDLTNQSRTNVLRKSSLSGGKSGSKFTGEHQAEGTS